MNLVMCVVDALFLGLCVRARVGRRTARDGGRRRRREGRLREKYYSYRVLTGSAHVLPRIAGVERLHLQDHGR